MQLQSLRLLLKCLLLCFTKAILSSQIYVTKLIYGVLSRLVPLSQEGSAPSLGHPLVSKLLAKGVMFSLEDDEFVLDIV